jgi:hypothetical protein
MADELRQTGKPDDARINPEELRKAFKQPGPW